MKIASIKIAGAGSSVIAAVFTFNLSCFAEDESISTPGNSGPGMFAMVSQVILFLLLILGLFFVIVRLVSKKNQMFQSGRALKTLGGVTLGQNKSIQLVEVGHRLYVIGVGDNVQKLAEIDDADEIEYIRERTAANAQVKLDKLFSWTKRWQTRSDAVNEEQMEKSSFQQVFHDKLKRVTSSRQDVEQWMQDDRVNKP